MYRTKFRNPPWHDMWKWHIFHRWLFHFGSMDVWGNVQAITHIFHFFLCCILMLKLFSFFPSSVYTQYPQWRSKSRILEFFANLLKKKNWTLQWGGPVGWELSWSHRAFTRGWYFWVALTFENGNILCNESRIIAWER